MFHVFYNSLFDELILRLNFSAEETVIPSHGKGLVKTDLSIVTPPGTYARIGLFTLRKIKFMVEKLSTFL